MHLVNMNKWKLEGKHTKNYKLTITIVIHNFQQGTVAPKSIT